MISYVMRWRVSFKSIVGHDGTVAFLLQAIKNDKVAHAYIFSGPSGIGKASVAINFAKALNCPGGSGGIPCDSCASCRKIDAVSHPDVRLMRSNTDSAFTGIDDVRGMIKDAALRPYEGRRKVYIIDGAEALTHQAQGALLKTFEEPSRETVIILVVENPENILPTILSRGEVVKFFPIKKDEVKDILIKEHGVDIARAHILAGLSAGRIGEAVKKVSDERFFERRSHIIDALLEKTFFDTEKEKPSREEIKSELDIMLTWFRDILITKADPAGGVDIINVDRKESIAREAKALDFEYLDRVIHEIMATDSHLDSNVNAKLAMSVLGMEVNSNK